MSSELKDEVFEHISKYKVVVIASINGADGTIFWRGAVESQFHTDVLFEEVLGKSKKEVFQELAKRMTSYIQTMQVLQAYCQQWGQEIPAAIGIGDYSPVKD